jgi:L-ascorbate metabolism protein UlaG (beta-lactamase superfamily)
MRFFKHLLFCMAIPCLLSCLPHQSAFDEEKWRQDVERADPATLYAPHVKDGKYFNPWMPMGEKGMLTLLRWRLSKKTAYTDEEKAYRPKIIANLKKRIHEYPEGDFICWLGHGSFLIRINGEYWFTDPMLSQRALLPARKTPPPITIDELKQLGGKMNILISHNHYDHLDKKTVEAFPEASRVFVPRGLKGFILGMNKKDVREMDWWQTLDCGNNTHITFLPAQHWSRRIFQDVNTTLWGSYLIATPHVKIYYGADSGYFIGYKEFGRKFHGIDYALMPITAYHPRWFMHYAHVDVRESIDAFRDLGARYFVPQQWGTFHLGDEPVGYAVLELKKIIIEQKLDPDRFAVLDVGQILPIKRLYENTEDKRYSGS